MAFYDMTALRQRPLPALRSRVMRLASLARQRRRLAELDDRALADIGVSRAEARAEAARPVWDVPIHWQG